MALAGCGRMFNVLVDIQPPDLRIPNNDPIAVTGTVTVHEMQCGDPKFLCDECSRKLRPVCWNLLVSS